jgi:hypothetical protein
MSCRRSSAFGKPRQRTKQAGKPRPGMGCRPLAEMVAVPACGDAEFAGLSASSSPIISCWMPARSNGSTCFDVFNSLVAEKRLIESNTAQPGSKDLTFSLGKPAVCGVSAAGTVAVPSSTFSASVFRQSQNAFHAYHCLGEA